MESNLEVWILGNPDPEDSSKHARIQTVSSEIRSQYIQASPVIQEVSAENMKCYPRYCPKPGAGRARLRSQGKTRHER